MKRLVISVGLIFIAQQSFSQEVVVREEANMAEQAFALNWDKSGFSTVDSKLIGGEVSLNIENLEFNAVQFAQIENPLDPGQKCNVIRKPYPEENLNPSVN